MAGILTELCKYNYDAQRMQQYPTIASIELQERSDTTRAYVKIVSIVSGWMLVANVYDPAQGRHITRLYVTENAVTDAVDTLLTVAHMTTGLKAVLIGTERYLTKNPVAPSKEPRYWSVEIERIAE